MKTIYKLDSKGKIRVLIMSTEGDLLVQETGLIDGKKVIAKSQCSPKNTGKKNATTGDEQALKELDSKIKLKLRNGYFNTIEEAKNEVVSTPMLAKVYEKHSKKIDWTTAYVQCKMDGLRGFGRPGSSKYSLFSRTNKEIDTLGHITKDLSHLTYILDGEIFCESENFQNNMKLIKKYRAGVTETVKWHVYDLVSDDTFIDRYNKLTEIIEDLDKTNPGHNLVLVSTYKVNSYEGMMEYHSRFLAEGYEGTMLRWGNKEYKLNGRSDQLLKVKDFIDRTATLIDVVPEERRPEFGKALCRMINDDDIEIEFTASFKVSHDERKLYLKNKEDYIGQTAEIRFFEYTTSDVAIPRFPICVGFRIDK